MIKVLREATKDELYDFLYEIDVEDKKLYEEINSDRSLNIFQFSGNTAKKVVAEIHPDNFEELTICNAAARPGTIDFVPDYVKAKAEGVRKYPPAIHSVLGKSRGCLFYQEQIMNLFNVIGGLTLEETNGVRATMKKLSKADKKKEDLDKWENYTKKFVDGATKNNVKKEEALKVADDLLKLSQYSFNYSHAVAYTYNALMTLYLSVYFRIYYYSATLSYLFSEKRDELLDGFNTVQRTGIKILPPSISISNKQFTPYENTIRVGLCNIKFVGDKPAEFIIEHRPYKSLLDFYLKTVVTGSGVNIGVIRALICAGAFDEIDTNRKKLLYIIETFYERKKTTKVEEKLVNLYLQIEKEANLLGLETTHLDYINYEIEFFEFNFFHSYFTDKMKETFYTLEKRGLIELVLKDVSSSVKVPVLISKMRNHIDKNGNEMAFVDFEDMYGERVSVPIFASIYKALKEMLKMNGVYLANFYRNKEDGKVMFGNGSWIETDEAKRRLVRPVIIE